jgi:hypothetical protein
VRRNLVPQVLLVRVRSVAPDRYYRHGGCRTVCDRISSGRRLTVEAAIQV